MAAEHPPQRGIVARIYANLGMLLGGKAAAGLISLGYMLIATRALGPSGYGVLVLVHAFAVLVGGIVAFPGWQAVVRYGARALADGDEARLARLLRFAALIEGASGVLAIAATATLAPLLGARLGWSPAALAFAVPYSFVVLESIHSTPAGYLQLVGRFDLLGAHNAIAPTVRLAGAILVAVTGGGLHGFLVAWLVAGLVEWASLWIIGLAVARRRISAPLVGDVRGVLADNPGIWRFLFATKADATFGELAGRLTPLVVGGLLGPAATGLYSIAKRATVVIAQPAQILGNAAYPELARLVAAGESGEALRRAVQRCIGIALLAALPLLTIIILFGSRLAVLMGGHAYGAAGGVMAWLAAAQVVLLVVPPFSAALVALGRPALSVAGNVAGSVGLLPLLPLFLRDGGLVGIGVQTLAQALLASGLFIWLVRRESAGGRAPRRALALA